MKTQIRISGKVHGNMTLLIALIGQEEIVLKKEQYFSDYTLTFSGRKAAKKALENAHNGLMASEPDVVEWVTNEKTALIYDASVAKII